MARTPQLKVYKATDEYVAACVYAEDAAAIVGTYSCGATIRNGHAKKHTVWTEGIDGNAADSHDAVAQLVWERIIQKAQQFTVTKEISA